jgi:DNA polymerase III epsilon subunit-like protein
MVPLPYLQVQDAPVDYVAVDIEGNGHWGAKEEIVELSVVHVLQHTPCDAAVWLFKPQHPIRPVASKIHGIFSKDVDSMPSFADCRTEVETQLTHRAVVLAHNAATDIRLLMRDLPEWQPLGVIDTMILSRKLFPDLVSYKLSELIDHFSLTNIVSRTMRSLWENDRATPHSALYDTCAAIELFEKILRPQGVVEVTESQLPLTLFPL